MKEYPKVHKVGNGYNVIFDIHFEADIFVELCKYHRIENPTINDGEYLWGVLIEVHEHLLWTVLIPQIKCLMDVVRDYIYAEYLMGNTGHREVIDKIIKEIPKMLLANYNISNIIYEK